MSTIKLLPGMMSSQALALHISSAYRRDPFECALAAIDVDRAQWAAEIERLTELCAVIQAREIEWCSTAQTASRAATGAEAKIEDLRFALREVRSVLRACQYDPGSAAPRTRSISNRRDGVLCDCRTCGPAATLDAALAGGSR
jgi:hypothetical protein